jgi:hypothetical protein
MRLDITRPWDGVTGYPMLMISYYFLGLAAFFFAALLCFSLGKRAGKCVEVDLDALHAASICLPTGRRGADDVITTTLFKELVWEEKVRLSTFKTIWTQWYDRCKKRAIQKQKTMYSWTRTLALSAVLCLTGVLLEAEFDQPITIRNVLAGFRRQNPMASNFQEVQLPLPQSISTSLVPWTLQN